MPPEKDNDSRVGYIVLLIIMFVAGYFFATMGSTEQNSENISKGVDMTEFWEVWDTINDSYVSSTGEVPTDEEKVWGSISGLVDSLGDPHSLFFNPENKKIFEDSIASNFVGVGIEITLEDELVTVIAPIKGSPAEKAGVKSRDRIIGIDGESIFDISIDEAVARIRGEEDTTVTLQIARETETEVLDIPITRSVIAIPTLETEVTEDNVFVIRLFNFTGDSVNQFSNALSQFNASSSDKLILDLRGNPGGFLDAAVEITGWLLSEGKVIVREDYGPKQEGSAFRSTGKVIKDNSKLVVLVDSGSASASEILAGAVKAHEAGTIIGVNTFGKGSVQEFKPVSRNTALKLTIARWLTPDGNSISENGIEPTIIVERSESDIESAVDSQFDRAVEFLLSL